MNIEEPHEPKLKKCPFCNEKIAYMYSHGEKIAITGHKLSDFRWNEHTCYIELPQRK